MRTGRAGSRDGSSQRTALILLADARDYVLGMSEDRQLRRAWQQAARLMMDAAAGGSIEAATDQIELALFFDAKLMLAP